MEQGYLRSQTPQIIPPSHPTQTRRGRKADSLSFCAQSIIHVKIVITIRCGTRIIEEYSKGVQGMGGQLSDFG